MFDAPIRRVVARLIAGPTRSLGNMGISPNMLSVCAAMLGVLAALLVAREHALAGLATWLVSRIVDGMDGILARETNRVTPFGGYLDITLDMMAYSAMLLGFAWIHPEGGWVWAAILVGYLLVTTTTLALSSVLEKEHAKVRNNDRSLQFTPGFAEAGETTVVYALFALLPSHVTPIGWVWAAVCAATVVQRSLLARRLLP